MTVRLILTVEGGPPHGRHLLIVDGAAEGDADRYLRAAVDTPTEILTIPNARLHVDAEPGTASVMAARIVAAREED